MSEAEPPFTFLMVPVPAADALVRAAAARFEPTSPTAALSSVLVAAHVTVLSPFLPPPRIDQRIVDQLRTICASHARHAFVLAWVAIFDGGTTYVAPGRKASGMAGVYLAPQPSGPLLQLMQSIWQCWPETPPYDGLYKRVVPHVTLAIVANEREQIARVTDFAQPFLPLHAEAREVQLLLVRDRTWELMHRFELAVPDRS